MEFRVLKSFKDKVTSIIYHAGTTYEASSRQRADELRKSGFLSDREILVRTNNEKYYPRTDLLFEDDFTDGLQGWTWLMDDSDPMPGPVWSTRRSHIGTGAMLLETGDVLRMDKSHAGTATAIKRLTLPRKSNGEFERYIQSEYWFGWSSGDKDNPSFIQFGLDTQRNDITAYRSYFKIRFENYDDNAGKRTGILKIATPNGYEVVSGEDIYSYFNEAKGGFFHLIFVVDILTGKYVSLKFNGKEYDISDKQCSKDGYVLNNGGTYDFGMNFSVDVFNRLNTTKQKQCKLYIPYVKGDAYS